MLTRRKRFRSYAPGLGLLPWCCGPAVAQNHADKRDQTRENHDGFEHVRSSCLACIGKIADQFESDNGSDACAGPAQAADACNRIAMVEVRR